MRSEGLFLSKSKQREGGARRQLTWFLYSSPLSTLLLPPLPSPNHQIQPFPVPSQLVASSRSYFSESKIPRCESDLLDEVKGRVRSSSIEKSFGVKDPPLGFSGLGEEEGVEDGREE